jgi:ankyrin repeat protein
MTRLLPATLAATALALVLSTAPALAQSLSQKQAEAEADAQERAKRAEQAKEDAAKAPPAAIPGAVATYEAAPAAKNAGEMSPNDALFDAINRGDGAAARDAISRGAQLDAHNVLGQTPLDSAIEANRNDITFLLLSMRGAVGLGPHGHAAMAAAAPAPLRHGAPNRHLVAHLQATPASARVAAADPGRPDPAAGFNGF